jgi:hypothetical protein
LICLAYFLYVIIYGTGRFGHLAGIHEAIAADSLNRDLGFIWRTAAVGLVAEAVIAFREQWA